MTRRFIGNKRHNIGFLSIKNHRSYSTPNAIYIRKKRRENRLQSSKNHTSQACAHCHHIHSKNLKRQRKMLIFEEGKEVKAIRVSCTGGWFILKMNLKDRNKPNIESKGVLDSSRELIASRDIGV